MDVKHKTFIKEFIPLEGVVIKDEPSEGIEYDGADDLTFKQILGSQEIQIETCDSNISIKSEIEIKEESYSFGIKDYQNSENFQQIFGINERKDLIEECHNNSGDSPEEKNSLGSGHQEFRRGNESIEHYNRKELSCSYCCFIFEREDELISHLESCEGKVKCSRCSSSCNCESNLKIQMLKKINTDQSTMKSKSFKCSKCNYECNREESFTAHIFRHQNIKLFKCCKCSFECNHKGRLKAHMLTHHDILILKCYDCSFECNLENSSKSHELKHLKIFKCSECNFESNVESKFKRHMIKHLKLLKCSECNYECKTEWHFNRHMLKHGNTKLFKCSECNYECNQKGNLRLHVLKHQNKVKIYQCSKCDYQCNKKYCLNRHTLIHQNIKFKCSECNHESNANGNFKTTHVKTSKFTLPTKVDLEGLKGLKQKQRK